MPVVFSGACSVGRGDRQGFSARMGALLSLVLEKAVLPPRLSAEAIEDTGFLFTSLL